MHKRNYCGNCKSELKPPGYINNNPEKREKDCKDCLLPQVPSHSRTNKIGFPKLLRILKNPGKFSYEAAINLLCGFSFTSSSNTSSDNHALSIFELLQDTLFKPNLTETLPDPLYINRLTEFANEKCSTPEINSKIISSPIGYRDSTCNDYDK